MATLSSILGSTFEGDVGPQGPQGVQGEQGLSASISVGTVTTLAPGSSATVSNVGTSTDAIFNFGIPEGEGINTGKAIAMAIVFG